MEDDQPDLKRMVYAFAATVATRCVEIVDANDLTYGVTEDKIDAGGIEWHILASYNSDDACVRVKGHPHRRDEDDPEQSSVLASIQRMQERMFGVADDDAFEFNMPKEWLPKAGGAA